MSEIPKEGTLLYCWDSEERPDRPQCNWSQGEVDSLGEIVVSPGECNKWEKVGLLTYKYWEIIF